MRRKERLRIRNYVPFLAGLLGAVIFYRGADGKFTLNPENRLNLPTISEQIKNDHEQSKYYLELSNVYNEAIQRQGVELRKLEKRVLNSNGESVEATSITNNENLENYIDNEDAKYKINPTQYADKIQNGEVRIIKRRGTKVTEAEGIASWYSVEDNGRRTASGIKLDDNKKTVAINERLGLPLLSKVKITNLENGLATIVDVTDHGPYKFNRYGRAIWGTVKNSGRTVIKYIPHETRIVDTSIIVAKELGFYGKGLARVRVEYLGN